MGRSNLGSVRCKSLASSKSRVLVELCVLSRRRIFFDVLRECLRVECVLAARADAAYFSLSDCVLHSCHLIIALKDHNFL